MAAATSSNLYPSFSSMYTMRRWIPVPVGIVMERAAFTPSIAFTATVCPMLIPGPKFVYVIPFGAIASSMVRTMESLPGSHPAEMIDTALCSLAVAFSVRRKSTMPVWISKLSTVLMPIARYSLAYFSTLRVGVQRIATSTSPSSFMSFTTA